MKGLMITLLLSSLLMQSVAQSQTVFRDPKLTNIATLGDGVHQLCSEPKPKNWQQGAGVCFVFSKKNDQVDGYYGYPHSDGFVCVRGRAKGDRILGQAYLVSWQGDRWNEVPTSAFHWDAEKRLLLNQGKLIQHAGASAHNGDWIIFRQAKLDVNQFYHYRVVAMNPPNKLCDWRFN
jgi:hypothetical protein